jgi:probable F420-dependent oxidoreductase
MQFGLQVRPMAGTMALSELGQRVEAAGFESLFAPEHTHIPVSVGKSHSEGAEWLDACKRFFDPFLALTVVASATERLKLGTGICLVPQHHPITLAKKVATLDVLSGGRVIFGIGAGWDGPELVNHGVVPGQRWAVLREHVLAMKAIWTADEAEFAGEHVRFDPIWQWPKPVQQPHPPILVGGEGPRVLDRVLEYGDGWLPNDHPEVGDRIAELNQRAAEQARDPLPVTVYAVDPQPSDIERLAAAGADRIVFNLPKGDAEVMLSALRRLTNLISPWSP